MKIVELKKYQKECFIYNSASINASLLIVNTFFEVLYVYRVYTAYVSLTFELFI